MKNVAKCDTWCELQNPANHRVFERKLRPKPIGRGHACLGVTHRVAPPEPRVLAGARRGRMLVSRAPPRARLAQRQSPSRQASRRVVVDRPRLRLRPRCAPPGSSRDPPRRRPPGRPVPATPGQAGLPAEFKHINKRRKRNLRGFP